MQKGRVKEILEPTGGVTEYLLLAAAFGAVDTSSVAYAGEIEGIPEFESWYNYLEAWNPEVTSNFKKQHPLEHYFFKKYYDAIPWSRNAFKKNYRDYGPFANIRAINSKWFSFAEKEAGKFAYALANKELGNSFFSTIIATCLPDNLVGMILGGAMDLSSLLADNDAGELLMEALTIRELGPQYSPYGINVDKMYDPTIKQDDYYLLK